MVRFRSSREIDRQKKTIEIKFIQKIYAMAKKRGNTRPRKRYAERETETDVYTCT